MAADAFTDPWALPTDGPLRGMNALQAATLSAVAVPEPASGALALGGAGTFVMLTLWRRRRQMVS